MLTHLLVLILPEISFQYLLSHGPHLKLDIPIEHATLPFSFHTIEPPKSPSQLDSLPVPM